MPRGLPEFVPGLVIAITAVVCSEMGVTICVGIPMSTVLSNVEIASSCQSGSHELRPESDGRTG